MHITFSGVIGHRASCETLDRALAAGRAHAFLLLGPRSVGKTTVAEHAAASLLGCAVSDLARHGDVFRLAPEVDEKTGEEKSIGVEAVEALIASLTQSAAGAVKVAIIASVDRMNERAQNALLKTVEEPCGNTVLFMTAEDAERVLPTLRSRMMTVTFGTVTDDVITAFLAESGKTKEECAHVVLRAQGRPGLAIRLCSDDVQTAHDEREQAVQSILTGPKSARLRAAAVLTKGDDAASQGALAEIAARAGHVLHTTLLATCGTMSSNDRRAYAQSLALLAEAPGALREYANPALIFERIILTLP